MRVARLAVAIWALAAAAPVQSAIRAQSLSDAIDASVQPHLAAHEFAGAILVTRDGDIVFDKAYGAANLGTGLGNTTATSFHIGALSMAWTAAVVMHLAEKHALSLDNSVAQFLPDVPNGDRITIRALLETDPASPAGAQSWGLLARIAALRAGTSFEEVLNALVFAPYWMDGAGIDNNDLEPERRFARGYVSDGTGGLKPADAADWSALKGMASLYATTRDELRFVDLLFGDSLLTQESRAAMFAAAPAGFGYGWYRSDDNALGGRFYFMSGRNGGFSAFVMRVPSRDATVILLGNIDSATTAEMGRDIAALLLAKP
jgi:CubicO group peptidase (beta-lactamase class C family)